MEIAFTYSDKEFRAEFIYLADAHGCGNLLRRHHGKKIVIANLWKRYGANCHYCDRELLITRALARETPKHGRESGSIPSLYPTIEHLVPLLEKRQGRASGVNELSNLRLACRKCNNSRGAEQNWMRNDFDQYHKV